MTGDGLRGVVMCEYGETFNCEGLKSLTFLPDDFHVGPRPSDQNLPAGYHTPHDATEPSGSTILASGSGLTMDRIPEHLRSKVRGL